VGKKLEEIKIKEETEKRNKIEEQRRQEILKIQEEEQAVIENKRQKIKNIIKDFPLVYPAKGAYQNIRDIFIVTVSLEGKQKDEPIDYDVMINKMGDKSEDKLKVLLNELYFYDEHLYNFKEIFVEQSSSSAKDKYKKFGEKINGLIHSWKRGWKQ
jgi:hypothetical protein